MEPYQYVLEFNSKNSTKNSDKVFFINKCIKFCCQEKITHLVFFCHSHPPGNQMKPMDCYEDGQAYIFSEEEFQQLSLETESVYKRILKDYRAKYICPTLSCTAGSKIWPITTSFLYGHNQ